MHSRILSHARSHAGGGAGIPALAAAAAETLLKLTDKPDDTATYKYPAVRWWRLVLMAAVTAVVARHAPPQPDIQAAVSVIGGDTTIATKLLDRVAREGEGCLSGIPTFMRLRVETLLVVVANIEETGGAAACAWGSVM